VTGNSKGFLDVHQTPEGVLPFVPKGQDPTKSCSFADGSKQALELCVVANAFGFPPRRRGMFGPTTTKQEIVRSFAGLADLQSESPAFVDYVMGMDGVDQGGGIFVIASREGRHIGPDLEYMKKGRGPNYLFFRDHHLCYLEAASSIAEAALFAVPTLVARDRHADVVAVAKRDLPAGQKLDGIGGFDCYGLIERADVAAAERLLPLGLAELATLRVDVARDIPITYDMVELEDTVVVRLRRHQDREVSGGWKMG
jgi:predicted homoserine dehydrogenase-like protein